MTDADVIIIGAGIAGALAAEYLAQKGKSVLMLEAGPRVRRLDMVEKFRQTPNKNNYNLFYPELAHAPKSNGGPYSDTYLEQAGPMRWKPDYLKLAGGTTWHWSAAYWRYIPNDFKLQSQFGVGRDWPISYDDLEPWYTLAETVTGASGNAADDQSGQGRGAYPPRSAPYPLPPEQWSSYTQTMAAKMARIGLHFIDEPHLRASRPYNGRPACQGNNNCSPICPIGAMYSGDMAVDAAERAGARLITNAVAYKLERGEGGKIAAVHTYSPEGVSTRRTARAFVIAAHAIETPKLLLISDVANSSGMVGRNLTSHPSMVWEALVKDPVWPGRGPVQQGTICDRRDGPQRAQYASIRYVNNQRGQQISTAQRLLGQGVIGSELDRRIRDESARFVSLIGGMEMLPDPANRITLSANKDALGLPKPVIHADVDDYVRRGGDVIQSDFANFAKILEMQTLLSDPKQIHLIAHVMGSTIMGDDPKNAVVDRDCRTHDHPNLFIAGTSVFASASVVNPTLTGVALSLRVAHQISTEI